MASLVAIAIRKKEAIGRIAAALGVDLDVAQRDARMAEAMLLERIADAVEGNQADEADLASAIESATVEELAELPGIGEATAKRVKKATAKK